MNDNLNTLLQLINAIRAKKQRPALETLDDSMQLRGEIGFDSLDLAEFVVKIERDHDVDIFADGILQSIGEVRTKLGL